MWIGGQDISIYGGGRVDCIQNVGVGGVKKIIPANIFNALQGRDGYT